MAQAQALHKNPFKAKALSQLLIKFSAPAVAGMFVNAIYNIISRIYVGQHIGALGIAGISILFPLGLLFLGFSALVGVGANALFSIRLGEKRTEEAQQILGNAFVLLAILSGVITLGTYLFLDPVLAFLGADQEVLPYARAYTQTVMPGYFLFGISLGLNNFIRASGNPKTAMGTQLIGAGINLVLGPIFIFVLDWGMRGAALATVCGQTVSFAWIMLFFTRKNSLYRLRWRFFRLKWHIVWASMTIGFSQFAFQMASSMLNVILNHALLKYGGNVAISAIGIAISVNTIITMPLLGLSQGAQPLIGYNHGAKKARQVVSIFNSTDQQLIYLASYAVRVLNIMLPFVSLQILTTSFFQAVNKPLQAALLSLSRQVLLVIPLVLILPLFLGLNGVFFSPPIADAISVIVAVKLLKNYFDRHKQNFFFSKKHSVR